MTEAMFFDQKVDWSRMEPHHILALRACAHDGVFTQTAKAGYLSQVSDDHDRSGIADALFTVSDTEFLKRLPEKWQSLKPQLKILMQLARGHGIR